MSKEGFIQKYGSVEVTFCYYYKYQFTFKGQCKDGPITVSIGCRAEDIYRTEVTNKPIKISELEKTDEIISGYVGTEKHEKCSFHEWYKPNDRGR